jgi:hypothetical protein
MKHSTTTVDTRTFWIGVSAIIFAILLGLHAVTPNALLAPASAGETADSRDYQLATSAQPDGSEALYVLDKRNGFVAMVQWNISAGRPEVIDIEPLAAAFN